MTVPSQSSRLPARAEVRRGCWIDSRLALWLEPERLLVLADLHWGYAASHRARGNLLPAWGDEQIAERIRTLVADYQPSEMIWLGDIVHAVEGAAAVEAFLADAPVPTTLLAGNHDRRWSGASARTLQRGNYFFHHGDQSVPVPAGCIEVVGHHHPAVGWWDGAGGRLKLPALVAREDRLVLPAFSPWAAGTAWPEATSERDRLWAIAPNRIFALAQRAAASAAAP